MQIHTKAFRAIRTHLRRHLVAFRQSPNHALEGLQSFHLCVSVKIRQTLNVVVISSYTMPSPQVHLTPIQLQWLREKQELVDKEVERIEINSNTSHAKEISEAQAYVNWNLMYKFQSKLNCDAHDMKIPPEATPNAYATWNAMRNRLGRGTRLRISTTLQLKISRLVMC